jgi:hypothetical protein
MVEQSERPTAFAAGSLPESRLTLGSPLRAALLHGSYSSHGPGCDTDDLEDSGF